MILRWKKFLAMKKNIKAKKFRSNKNILDDLRIIQILT